MRKDNPLKIEIIQLGDYAIVGKNFYIIKSITKGNITIIKDDKYVTLFSDEYGNYFLDDIEVKLANRLISDYSSDILVLALLDNDHLINLCDADECIKSMYKGEDLWKKKLEIEYGKDILDHIHDDYRKNIGLSILDLKQYWIKKELDLMKYQQILQRKMVMLTS